MSKKKQLEALYDAVIVQPYKPEEDSSGNIIVPDLGQEKNQQATVIDVGPGKQTVTGELIATRLKVGDKVLLPTMGFTKFEFNNEEYYIGPEQSVLAKINK